MTDIVGQYTVSSVVECDDPENCIELSNDLV